MHEYVDLGGARAFRRSRIDGSNVANSSLLAEGRVDYLRRAIGNMELHIAQSFTNGGAGIAVKFIKKSALDD